MAEMEFETQINAPPEKVFAYVSDLEKHQEWARIDEIEKTSEGPIALGSTYKSKGTNLGLATDDRVEVMEFQPNERFAWRATGAFGVTFGWSFELRPQDGGTLLIQRHQPSKGPIAGAFFKLIAKGSLRKAMLEGLAKIKEKVEAS